MILIFSQERDLSTNQVIDWIKFFDKKFVRINSCDRLDDFTVFISNKELDIEFSFKQKSGKTVSFTWSEISSCWFRRGGLFRDIKLSLKKGKFKSEILKNLNWDWDTVKEYIFFLFKRKPHLGYYYDEINNNKLKNLFIARQCGLKIPPSIVSSNLNQVNYYLNTWDESITKCLRYPIKVSTKKEKIVGSLTRKITNENTKSYDLKIAPSFLQSRIQKKFELRVFFIEEQLYPMAIFSQNDPQTRLDFRNYNREKPNRYVPYILPENIQKKIIRFINLSGLNTGSIDIIYSEQNEYVFLEVNPVGQFSFVSFSCNYNLEKVIAQHLCSL